MRNNLLIILISIFSLLFLSLPAQEKYPRSYFRSPVDFPIKLSGSFGEPRKNHFHSGIDIRTEGVEGKPVFAPADGYVSRIFISSGGFGKALYITHPNGYSTVYGHLKGFNRNIAGWVRQRQYKDESFEQDISVDPGVLKIKKGELIAYAGNSGSSGGPHLHFEVRDAATQEVIDPLLFGFPVRDQIPPRIKGIRICPLTSGSRVNNSDKPVTLNVNGGEGRYAIISSEPVTVSGDVIFAIETNDLMNDNEIKTGISSIELAVDNITVFSQAINRFAFSETRYVNAILDYPVLISAQDKFLRSYIAPNNKLKVFQQTKDRGVVHFNDSKVHQIKYTVKDVTGNKSELIFSVTAQPERKTETSQPIKGKLFSCQKENNFSTSEIKLDVPAEALYEDLDFIYSVSSTLRNSFSGVHHLHNDKTPLHSFCELSIKPENIPDHLSSKALIVRVTDGRRTVSLGGKWEKKFIKTRIRDFGDYTVMIDTTPPVIKAVNITAQKKISGQNTIKMKISDNLSGIKSYRGSLNGKWILMDYDAKSGNLVYEFDDRMKSGRNEFKLLVRDGVGNESSYKAVLIR